MAGALAVCRKVTCMLTSKQHGSALVNDLASVRRTSYCTARALALYQPLIWLPATRSVALSCIRLLCLGCVWLFRKQKEPGVLMHFPGKILTTCFICIFQNCLIILIIRSVVTVSRWLRSVGFGLVLGKKTRFRFYTVWFSD